MITRLYIGLSYTCRKNREDYLRNWTRDNTQILINRIWQVVYFFFEYIAFWCFQEPNKNLQFGKQEGIHL
jgi:hypothetical protein